MHCMHPTVLLCGHLTKKRLDFAWREVESYLSAEHVPKEITLVINSDGWGDYFWGFIDKMNALTDVTFSAKVYTAKSAAALVALAANRREIEEHGLIEIHLGSVTLESNEVNSQGKVSGRITEQLRKGRERTFALMEKCGIPKEGPHMDQLLAQNWLTLNAEACSQLGIVERVV